MKIDYRVAEGDHNRWKITERVRHDNGHEQIMPAFHIDYASYEEAHYALHVVAQMGAYARSKDKSKPDWIAAPDAEGYIVQCMVTIPVGVVERLLQTWQLEPGDMPAALATLAAAANVPMNIRGRDDKPS